MQLLGEQRAADTSVVLLWTCPQSSQGFLFGFSLNTMRLDFDSVVYWFAFLEVSGEFFFLKIFLCMCILFFTDFTENCLIKIKQFLNKCFFTWLLA